ncbi:hypothetical protein LINGRAHAP2_LOCUS30191, partial [Linum grandiflorum]
MATHADDAVFTFSTEPVSVGRDRAATSLVARFFFSEPKPARLIQATLSNIYGLVRSLTVIELGFNLHQLFFTSKEAMQRLLKRRPIVMDGFLVSISPWKAPSPDLFRSLRFMKLWVQLEFVLEGSADDGFCFWFPRIDRGGLPPVCFRCGLMGHHHGRCSDLTVPLDLESRGPWISLPTGSYRRVNAYTLQPEPDHRSRDALAIRRPAHPPSE